MRGKALAAGHKNSTTWSRGASVTYEVIVFLSLPMTSALYEFWPTFQPTQLAKNLPKNRQIKKICQDVQDVQRA